MGWHDAADAVRDQCDERLV